MECLLSLSYHEGWARQWQVGGGCQRDGDKALRNSQYEGEETAMHINFSRVWKSSLEQYAMEGHILPEKKGGFIEEVWDSGRSVVQDIYMF